MKLRTLLRLTTLSVIAFPACNDLEQTSAADQDSFAPDSESDSQDAGHDVTQDDSQVDSSALRERADALRQRALEAGLVSLHSVELIELDPELVELGRELFFDPILGGEEDVACSTCHHPELGFADNVAFPIGVGGIGIGADRRYTADAHDNRPLGPLRPLGRSSPTVMNLQLLALEATERGLPTPFLWDGRADELSDFTQMPITVRDEMRGDAWPQLNGMAGLIERLSTNDAWRARFVEVYELSPEESLGLQHLQRAFNAFMLSLVSPPNPLDDFLAGSNAASPEFLNGLELFLDLSCVSCHTGVSLSDGGFHLTGVPIGELSRPLAGGIDIGRMEITGRERDRYMFRSGPLREIARTAPYMHNGAFETLEEVVRFYIGGSNPLSASSPPVADSRLERGTPRDLTAPEIADLVLFLETLSTPADQLPALYPEPSQVPSGLTPSAVPLNQRAGLTMQ